MFLFLRKGNIEEFTKISVSNSGVTRYLATTDLKETRWVFLVIIIKKNLGNFRGNKNSQRLCFT